MVNIDRRSDNGQRVYRTAIVGCGRVASTFDDDPLRTTIWTHAGAYQAHPRTELAAVADLNPEALKAFEARWIVPRLYPNARDLLTHEAVDILSVCTWSDTHQEIALLGAEAGVKAIWCEKPLSRNLVEADTILEGCRNLVLAVNHIRRWDTCYKKAKELLHKRAIGQIQGVTCTYSGGISDMGTHLFDTLMYLLGEAKAVWARPSASESLPDPNLSGDILFRDDLLVHVLGCDVRSFEIFEIDILGTDGRLCIKNNGYCAELWGVVDSPHYSGVRELELQSIIHEGDQGQRMVDAVYDIIHCLEHGGQTLCSGNDGRCSLEVAAAFLKSSSSERKVSLPLKGQDLYQSVPVR